MRLLALALLLSACGDDVYTDATVGYDARPVNTTCKALSRPASGAAATGLALTPVFSSVALVLPLAMLQAPGDGDRFYVVEQGGRVVTFSKSGTDATVALSFPSTDITAGGETGLLGLAFAPDWQTSHTAYTSRTAPGGSTGLRSVLARIRSTDGGLTFAAQPSKRSSPSSSRSPTTTAAGSPLAPTAFSTPASVMAAPAVTRCTTARTSTCCSARCSASIRRTVRPTRYRPTTRS